MYHFGIILYIYLIMAKKYTGKTFETPCNTEVFRHFFWRATNGVFLEGGEENRKQRSKIETWNI